MKKLLVVFWINFLLIQGVSGAILSLFQYPSEHNSNTRICGSQHDNDSISFLKDPLILVNGQDTVIFDFSNALCTGGYMQVPVRFNSDELIYAMDFALHFNPGIFTYISIVNHKSYLTYAATYNNADSTLRFSSYSFQPMDNNSNLISIRFSLPVSQIDFAQFDSVYTLLNGDVCSSKAIPSIPPPVIISSGSTTIFPGDSLSLSISPIPGLTYLWSNGETDSSINITSPGIYSINTFYPNGCNSISSILISPPDPLPVELLNFEAKTYDNTILISWSTASETNNSYFIVEHSIDGLNWKELGRVEGAGSSNSTRFYSLADKKPVQGNNYYRLKQFDFDGDFTYSEIVNTKFQSKPSNITVIIYPNPVYGNNINLTFENVSEITQMEISIVNSTGKVFLKEKLQVESGILVHKKILFNQNELIPKGFYIMYFKSVEYDLVKKIIIY